MATKMKTKAAIKAAKHYDQSKFVAMAAAGKTAEQIATATGASGVWVRRVLAKSNVKPSRATNRREKASFGTGQSEKEVIEEISRSVAAKTLSGSTMTPAPTTREAAFNSIQEGVAEGVKRVIGFRNLAK